jgi:hypothetical protein
MDMTPVKSSHIESVGYDAASKTMAVKFKSGGLYHYHDVSSAHHAELMSAESIGSHLAKTCGHLRYVKQ